MEEVTSFGGDVTSVLVILETILVLTIRGDRRFAATGYSKEKRARSEHGHTLRNETYHWFFSSTLSSSTGLDRV